MIFSVNCRFPGWSRLKSSVNPEILFWCFQDRLLQQGIEVPGILFVITGTKSFEWGVHGNNIGAISLTPGEIGDYRRLAHGGKARGGGYSGGRDTEEWDKQGMIQAVVLVIGVEYRLSTAQAASHGSGVVPCKQGAQSTLAGSQQQQVR